MIRQRIDQAVRKQVARKEALLRDVRRSGGKDNWPHLFSHGHAFPTVLSAVRHGYLSRPGHSYFCLTESGRWYLDTLDDALLSGASE